MKKLLVVCCFAMVAATVFMQMSRAVSAQEPAEVAQEKVAEAEAAGETPPQPALDKGDNAWLLTSSALVLMMTAPGLAMFYGGLVRKKNVVNVFMQCFFMMGLNTVLWALFCYSLCFGGLDASTGKINPYIGDASMFFMKGVGGQWSDTSFQSTPNFPGLTIPYLTHMLFQGMFFIITPALIVGSIAERMKFSTLVVFVVAWDFLVYCPLCHWVWAGGIFAYNTENGIAGGALGLCRRNGRAHQLGHLGHGRCTRAGQARRIPHRADAAAQPDLHLDRRRALVGGLVRVQCRQRPGGRRHCGQRLLQYPLFGRGCRPGLDLLGLDAHWQTNPAGRCLGCGRRIGMHYAGLGLRNAHGFVDHGCSRGPGLRPGVHRAQAQVWLRRFAGRLRRARRRRKRWVPS